MGDSRGKIPEREPHKSVDSVKKVENIDWQLNNIETILLVLIFPLTFQVRFTL